MSLVPVSHTSFIHSMYCMNSDVGVCTHEREFKRIVVGICLNVDIVGLVIVSKAE